MLISSETGSLVAMTFSELIPLSQIIEDSVRRSSLILAAKNCPTFHMSHFSYGHSLLYICRQLCAENKTTASEMFFLSNPSLLYLPSLSSGSASERVLYCLNLLGLWEKKNVLGEDKGIYWLHLDAYRPRQWFSCQKHAHWCLILGHSLLHGAGVEPVLPLWEFPSL